LSSNNPENIKKDNSVQASMNKNKNNGIKTAVLMCSFFC
jgi:hypothetical protein